ncbi:hypothetical protein [Pontibacter russatus]|uniref:hypothetical protein n=1 Tax=Pontibacter russatus TaxID=2694929 RepID=UPI00137A3D4B|nr:hypothetical protein [Pontibacter russatus]
MNWIQKVENIFREYFKDVFEKLGLVRYEEMDGPGMGALIKFKNKDFRVQLINDRGIIETELSPINDIEDFRSIELFYALITLNANPTIKGSEKRKILGKRLDFTDQARLLLDDYDQIKTLLDNNNFRNTLNQIDSLGRERFEQIIKR